MLNRRKFLTASAAGLMGTAIGMAPLRKAYAKIDETDTSKVIPVDGYIDPEHWTGGDEPVGIAWVFGVDISGSVNSSTNEYQAELDALADAVSRDDFRESIFQHAGPGSAAIFVVDFDTQSMLTIKGMDFRENDPAKFLILADMIRSIPRRNSGGTSHDAALQNAAVCFDMMPGGAECKRKHVNIMTDGTGNSVANKAATKLLAERHGAAVSSLTTRVGSGTIYDWCAENLTTPANTYTGPDGKIVPRGSTVEVATEMETRGSNVGRYQDQVFLAIRKQILLQTAGLQHEYMPQQPRTRFANALPQRQPDLSRRGLILPSSRKFTI